MSTENELSPARIKCADVNLIVKEGGLISDNHIMHDSNDEIWAL